MADTTDTSDMTSPAWPGHHNGMTDESDLARRIERLEATEAIRQLAARYALALDSRDVQTLASLFVPDVETGDGRVGREALAEWFDPILRPYATTFHFIGNHIIDLVDDDHATGVVYCRPEHEVGESPRVKQRRGNHRAGADANVHVTFGWSFTVVHDSKITESLD